MRKYSLIMMALALLVGMAQCKKEQVTPSENNGVNITLKVDGGSEKLEVYPATGAVIFTAGDKIYVGNNGKYVGTLIFENGLFQGTIDGDFSTNDFLHFYFVGNKPTSPTELTAGTTSYTVDISNQSTGLPAISYAPSKEKYSPTTTAYTAKLLNKSALVKFVLSAATNHPITVLGLNNEVQIDFAHHTLTPTGTTGGITLYSVSDTEKWAILLEQTTLSGLTVSASGFEAAIDEETLPSAINNNMYYSSGVGISMTATIPDGAIDGKFTINSNGDQVYFSKGNLQYQASTSTWRFAEHQYDYVGDASNGNVYVGEVKCNNANISSTYIGWIDLFGYGTSGYNNNQTCWQPYSTTENSSYYYSGNLSGNADWGYNAISNGGNRENMGWRSLTNAEWNYIFNTRNTSSNVRYAMGQVNGVKGVIVLPDDWDSSIYVFNNPNGGNLTSNTITVDEWNNLLEANGAAFLPAAGYRQNTVVKLVGECGNYFYNDYGHFLRFYNNEFDYGYSQISRCNGHSVRLVHDVE